MKNKLLIILLLGLISISFTGCLSMIFPELNNPPVITSTPIETATVGEAYTYDVEATDPDGDSLTYSLTDFPAGMTINATTGVITWTPTATGSYEVIVEVSDGKSSDTQSFTITVSEPEPINQSPLITSTAVTSVTLGETYNYTVEATDPDGDDLTYSLTAKPSGMTIDGNSGVITWTPTTIGSYYVTVKVSDGELSNIQSFSITVSPVPVGPTIVSLSPLEAIVGELYTGQVTATPGSDATLAYSLIGTPAGMTINSITGLISWTPATAGDQAVTVVVTDGAGLPDSKNFTIVVSPANQAPVITSTAITPVTVGEAYTYDVEATDPDGDSLTYSLTDFPAGMTINATTGVITWTPTTIGSYYVTVKVSDGELSNIQSFSITVSPVPVGPTVVSLSPLEAIVGELYTGQVTATPGSDATLAYSLVGAPAGMTINSITGLISWTPTTAGDQVVIVVVTDGAGLSDSKSFTIVVSPANQSPIITSIPDAIITAGETFTYTVEASDPDEGDTLIYSLTTNPSTDMAIDDATGVISWTPTATGSYEVIVEVSDGSESTTQSFTITVDKTLLTSIAVLPSNMTLEIGESKTITSVTAYYDNDTNADIDLINCSYESNKPSTATVNSSGVIKGIDSCTASTAAIITVTYTEDNITKTDTVSVVVTNPSPG